jgi:hypothetical protein
MGIILRASSVDKPKVKARFGEESASIAMVFNPLSAKPRARPAAIRVLPTPPLPETAIFMICSAQSIFVSWFIYVSMKQQRFNFEFFAFGKQASEN